VNGFGQLVEQVLEVSPPPARWTVLAAAVVAAVVVAGRRTWPVARHAVTVVHEAAHGLAAALTGRRLAGIRLHSDSSGVTVSSGRPTGPGMVLTLAAGYPGPALAGLGAAALLASGRPTAVLWAAVLVLAGVLAQVRNWFGLWSVLVCGLVVGAVTWWAPPSGRSAAALLLTWFLLLAAPRTVLELHRSRRRGPRTSDADQLARLTHLPALAWVVGFAVLDVAALVLAAGWLLRPG
jgi:hypothetical protein